MRTIHPTESRNTSFTTLARTRLNHIDLEGDIPTYHLAIELTPKEKLALDALAGWTWLSTRDMCDILGIRTRSQLWRPTGSLRLRTSHTNVRSTTQRRGNTTNPFGRLGGSRSPTTHTKYVSQPPSPSPAWFSSTP